MVVDSKARASSLARSTVSLLACAVTGTWLVVLVYGGNPDWMEDLAVYVGGGQAVFNGDPLYQLVVPPFGYQFVYPPFAALVFTPMTLVSASMLKVVWAFLNVVLAQLLVLLSLRWAGAGSPRTRLVLAAASALVVVWFAPVLATLETGQINLLIVLLVLADFALLSRSRAMGVGIGLAMALKLTPGVFVVYLLLTRRYRAVLTAVATFLGTVLLSLALLPTSTLKYWGGVFIDADRVAIAQQRFQQSLRGVVARVTHSTDITLLWACLAVVVAAAGLALAVSLWRRDEEQWALLVTAGVSLVVSPVSWEHHWVWLVPALTYLAARVRTPLAWLGWVLVTAAFALRPYAWAVPRDPAETLHVSDPLVQIAASWLPLLAVIGGVTLAGWLRLSRGGAKFRSGTPEHPRP